MCIRDSVHIDESDNPIPMVGKQHTSEPHDELIPVAKTVQIQGKRTGTSMGDVAEIGTVASVVGKYKIEKYIKVEPKSYFGLDIGNAPDHEEIRNAPTGYVTATEWQDFILSLQTGTGTPGDSLISDYFGNLELEYGEDGDPIAIKGGTTIGVRYGLRLSYNSIPIIYEEVDAVDGQLKNFSPLSGGTEILHCLIKALTENPEYKFITQYVFPMHKMLAFVAIYNIQAFLPSIGEIVDEPSNFSDILDFKDPGAQLNDNGGISSASKRAVSYTHLTLPTIYSV